MVWKGSDRRIGKVRLVIEKRFGKIAAMIFSFFVFCAECGRTDNKRTKTYYNIWRLANTESLIFLFFFFLFLLTFDDHIIIYQRKIQPDSPALIERATGQRKPSQWWAPHCWLLVMFPLRQQRRARSKGDDGALAAVKLR